MGFFESLFYTIWRGIAIGILISAPMGPVGILCIQRTLYKGRKTGLYTGIGAAVSDLFYCILTGFGLSFIEEFLERNQNIIQLAGSVVLIAFAVYLFKKNPASSLKTPENEIEHVYPHKNILGGFLFTFSNPLILFLIIGLFARFNFSIPEISFYYYIAGYAAIFVGCVLWWEFVTFTVNKLRAHFNLRSMWLINRIIGVIILLFAIVGIVTGVTNLASAETLHWNKGRGYLPFQYATENGLLIDNPSDTLKYDYLPLANSTEELTLNFRVRNLNKKAWGFFLTSTSDTLIFNFKGKEKAGMIESVPSLEIEAYSLKSGLIKSKIVSDKIDAFSGDNLLTLDATHEGILLGGGNTQINSWMELAGLHDITGIGFFAGWKNKILVSDINLEYSDSNGNHCSPCIMENLEDYLANSADEMEGYWMIFDRDLEESLLKPGGSYTLASIKDGEGYLFIYLDGAAINSKAWEPGDKKAYFRTTPFEGLYDVEWLDAMKTPLDYEIKAQQGEGKTLTIQFPYHSSKIRLRALPSQH